MIRKVCEKTTAIYGDHTTSKVEEPSYTTFNLRPRNASPSKPKKIPPHQILSLLQQQNFDCVYSNDL